MHPAKSVIFFTAASGAGYGIMVWLAVLALFGIAPPDRTFGLLGFGIGFALIVGGLVSSTLHLGHPERAWRALSQWRTSWLSREGVAAILTFAPLGMFALCWVVLGINSAPASLIGLIGAIMSLATVYCTAMIYASLKTIPAWHNSLVPPAYILLGTASGLVLLALLAAIAGQPDALGFLRATAIVWLPLALALKAIYWSNIDHAPPASTAGTATGLGHLGKVEMTGSPHDQDNYLLREMGYRIARKHSAKLRVIAMVLGFAMPWLAIVVLGWVDGDALTIALLAAAALSCMIGIATERWLFFAEAKHVVTLYYGEQAV